MYGERTETHQRGREKEKRRREVPDGIGRGGNI
jgi:hypothetical protein